MSKFIAIGLHLGPKSIVLDENMRMKPNLHLLDKPHNTNIWTQ